MSGSATPNHQSQTAREVPGAAGVDPSGADDPALTADVLIREVMVDQKRRDNHAALPQLKDDRSKDEAAPIKHPRRLFRKSKPAPTDAVSSAKGASLSRPLLRGVRALFDMLRSYRPSRKHLIFAAVIAIMYVRPWLIPITLFIAFWVVLIAYLTLGPDRVAEMVVGAWQKLRVRKPELAETFRQRAEATALRVDAALDRLPGSWTDGVHVPDFSKPDPTVADRPDPFDRLAREAQRG